MTTYQHSVEELRALAQAAINQKNLESAIAILSRVVEREPRSHTDWHQLAIAFAHSDDAIRAQKCLRKAVAIQPKNAEYVRLLAMMLKSQGQFAQAMANLRKAITLGTPNPAQVWVEIGRLHEQMRKPVLARQAAAKALETEPRLWSAHDLLGDLARAEGDLEAAMASYEKALETAANPFDKGSVLHAIGAIHEKRKEWDEAFAAHQRANDIRAAMDTSRGMLRTPPMDYRRDFAPENAAAFYERWGQARHDDDLPSPVLLVGFPRSGTTMTEQVLAALPGVRTTDEHPFMTPVMDRANLLFSRMEDPPPTMLERLDALTPTQVCELRAIYWNEVAKVVGPEALDHNLTVIDKHPLRILEVGLVNRLFPEARVIVMLRDPRDCCLSAYFQDLGLTLISVRFLKLDLLGDAYGTLLGLWLDIRESLTLPWMQLRYEDLVTNFETEARRLVEFVGQPWTDDVLRFNEKAAQRAINTPSYQAVTEKVNTRAVGKWARYERHLGPLIEKVAPFLDEFGYER